MPHPRDQSDRSPARERAVKRPLSLALRAYMDSDGRRPRTEMVGLAVLGPPERLPEGKKTIRRLTPGLQRPMHRSCLSCQTGKPPSKERNMLSDNNLRQRNDNAPAGAKSRGGAKVAVVPEIAAPDRGPTRDSPIVRTTFTQVDNLRTSGSNSATCYLITPYVNESVCAPLHRIREAVRKRILSARLRAWRLCARSAACSDAFAHHPLPRVTQWQRRRRLKHCTVRTCDMPFVNLRPTRVLSATITLPLERQLEFPVENQRRAAPPFVKRSAAERNKRGGRTPPRVALANLRPRRAAWFAWPRPTGSSGCSTPRSRCDAPGGRLPPLSSSDP